MAKEERPPSPIDVAESGIFDYQPIHEVEAELLNFNTITSTTVDPDKVLALSTQIVGSLLQLTFTNASRTVKIQVSEDVQERMFAVVRQMEYSRTSPTFPDTLALLQEMKALEAAGAVFAKETVMTAVCMYCVYVTRMTGMKLPPRDQKSRSLTAFLEIVADFCEESSEDLSFSDQQRIFVGRAKLISHSLLLHLTEVALRLVGENRRVYIRSCVSHYLIDILQHPEFGGRTFSIFSKDVVWPSFTACESTIRLYVSSEAIPRSAKPFLDAIVLAAWPATFIPSTEPANDARSANFALFEEQAVGDTKLAAILHKHVSSIRFAFLAFINLHTQSDPAFSLNRVGAILRETVAKNLTELDRLMTEAHADVAAQTAGEPPPSIRAVAKDVADSMGHYMVTRLIEGWWSNDSFFDLPPLMLSSTNLDQSAFAQRVMLDCYDPVSWAAILLQQLEALSPDRQAVLRTRIIRFLKGNLTSKAVVHEQAIVKDPIAHGLTLEQGDNICQLMERKRVLRMVLLALTGHLPVHKGEEEYFAAAAELLASTSGRILQDYTDEQKSYTPGEGIFYEETKKTSQKILDEFFRTLNSLPEGCRLGMEVIVPVTVRIMTIIPDGNVNCRLLCAHIMIMLMKDKPQYLSSILSRQFILHTRDMREKLRSTININPSELAAIDDVYAGEPYPVTRDAITSMLLSYVFEQPGVSLDWKAKVAVGAVAQQVDYAQTFNPKDEAGAQTQTVIADKVITLLCGEICQLQLTEQEALRYLPQSEAVAVGDKPVPMEESGSSGVASAPAKVIIPTANFKNYDKLKIILQIVPLVASESSMVDTWTAHEVTEGNSQSRDVLPSLLIIGQLGISDLDHTVQKEIPATAILSGIVAGGILSLHRDATVGLKFNSSEVDILVLPDIFPPWNSYPALEILEFPNELPYIGSVLGPENETSSFLMKLLVSPRSLQLPTLAGKKNCRQAFLTLAIHADTTTYCANEALRLIYPKESDVIITGSDEAWEQVVVAALWKYLHILRVPSAEGEGKKKLKHRRLHILTTEEVMSAKEIMESVPKVIILLDLPGMFVGEYIASLAAASQDKSLDFMVIVAYSSAKAFCDAVVYNESVSWEDQITLFRSVFTQFTETISFELTPQVVVELLGGIEGR